METYQLKWYERLLVALALPLVHLLGFTLRIREEGRRDCGPRAAEHPPVLWTLWHETILMCTWFFRDRGDSVMISSSRDGELVAQLARKLGYNPVRGSSTRGGREAAQALIRLLKDGQSGAITPDGPRGPRRKMQSGAVIIPRQSSRPVVAIAFAAERCWRLKSWDRFIIPKPFSRCVFVYGEPIAAGTGSDPTKELKNIQDEMDRVTELAEKYFRKSAESPSQ